MTWMATAASTLSTTPRPSSWGMPIPAVSKALCQRVVSGTAFFSPTPLEIEWAELLRARVPSLEHLRFCSSGTEAVGNALRVARAFTGRPQNRQI